MSEVSEKSCWGITLWAVALAVGAILMVSMVAGSDPSAGVSAMATISQ